MTFSQRPKIIDAVILSLFVVLVTLRPFFLHGEINLFEVGLYLPVVDAVLQNKIIFRDVFYLRGPFDIYMIAMLMKVFSPHVSVLYSYFYLGNVLSLVLCVWIAKELLCSRYIFYLFVPVVIGRTFPRVVFMFWGGMRYAFGLMAVYCAVKFFKHLKFMWMFWVGIFASLSLFTSIEMGVFVIAGTCGALLFSRIFHLHDGKFLGKSLMTFCGGMGIIAVPYLMYLVLSGALIPYVEAVFSVIFRMGHHFRVEYPLSLFEALIAMVTPTSKNFRHLTPVYTYLFLLLYAIFAFKKKKITSQHCAIVFVAVYGFVMYVAAFRNITGSQFEMALQPEKILLFFMLEVTFFVFLNNKHALIASVKQAGQVKWYDNRRLRIYFLNFCFVALFNSSVCYAINRYQKRFFSFQYVRDRVLGRDTKYLRPWEKVKSRALSIERAKGMIVPVTQADQLESLVHFLEKETGKNEPVLMYPEMGTEYFLANRPFIGRFPVGTLTWFRNDWHKEYYQEISSTKPQVAVINTQPGPWFEDIYFQVKENRRNDQAVMDLVQQEYIWQKRISNLDIYRHR